MEDENLREQGLVLYSGTYLNKGGAAIAYGTLKVLKELSIHLRYIIDPEPFPIEFFTTFNLTPIYRYSDIISKKTLPTISPIYTYKPFIKCLTNSYNPQIRQLRGAPLWHIGDSPFSDHRSRLSVIGQVIALQSLKTVINGKLIIGGISLEYPKTKTGEWTLRHFFRSVDHVFIRGSETYNNLRKLDVPDEKMSIICDFAFHLDKESSNESNRCAKLIRECGKPVIALILRDYSHGQHRKDYIDNISKLVSVLKRDYDVFFVPTAYSYFIPENDLIFLEKMLGIEHRQIINIKDFSPEEIISIFSNFDIIISARLHGAVLGALANVPTIHLYEGRKGLEVIGAIFGEAVPLIKLSDFAKSNGLNEVIKILGELLQRKDEISDEMKLCIKEARVDGINTLKSSLKEKCLL